MRSFPRLRRVGWLALAACSLTSISLLAQDPNVPPPNRNNQPPPPGAEGPGRPPGPGGPGGRGFGGVREKTKLIDRFDKDGDKVLNAGERKSAAEFLKQEMANGRGGRRGPGGGRGEIREPAQPGPRLSPSQVKHYTTENLYDPTTLRTFFLEFDDPNWESQMAAFKNSDVEMPATLTVDGKSYKSVGVHFRGASSFMRVGDGYKRSLNLTMDLTDKKQQLGGYRSLELLNSHEDPTFLRAVLSYQIERDYLPAPKANFVRVVINGESWGIYANVQAFNKDFLQENFGTTKGNRWKVPGSPGGQGGLRYLGDAAAPYKQIYQLKSKESPKAWSDLANLCKVLNESPAADLEKNLAPILNIDGALKFLALENTLINNDGYWIRASDYSIYQDPKGLFHILPHDSNETFTRPGGPGGGGIRVAGVELDPLVAANDPSKPLISKLLAVPSLRAKYLGYVRQIATQWLDWNKLGPVAQQYHSLIAEDVKADTRKLDSTESFLTGLHGDPNGDGGSGGRGRISLRSFAEQRRTFLLKTP